MAEHLAQVTIRMLRSFEATRCQAMTRTRYGGPGKLHAIQNHMATSLEIIVTGGETHDDRGTKKPSRRQDAGLRMSRSHYCAKTRLDEPDRSALSAGCVLISFAKVVQGHAALKEHFRAYLKMLGTVEVLSLDQLCRDRRHDLLRKRPVRTAMGKARSMTPSY